MAIETVVDSKGIYFITFTSHNWLPLIDMADAYQEVYQFFEVLKKEGNDIVGYVIMPNHLPFPDQLHQYIQKAEYFDR